METVRYLPEASQPGCQVRTVQTEGEVDLETALAHLSVKLLTLQLLSGEENQNRQRTDAVSMPDR